MEKCFFRILVFLFVLLQFTPSRAFAGTSQTKEVNVGESFWLNASSHTGIVGVTWTWDTDIFELTSNLSATSGQAQFKSKKASPSNGAYIQAITRYMINGATGSYTDYDDWRIIVKDNSTLSLSESYIEIEEGYSQVLTANVSPIDYAGSYTWTSENNSIAAVTNNGKNATVYGIHPGRTIIKVSIDTGKEAMCTVNVKEKAIDPNPSEGYEIVDLGLSVNWASKNIGANSPYGFGNRYSWGETSVKTIYNAAGSLTWNWEIFRVPGLVDSNYNLLPEHDAAHVNMGDEWRMPTQRELSELVDNCTFSKESNNGTLVYKVTGPNGKYIYIPYVSSGTTYWSSNSYANIQEASAAFIADHLRYVYTDIQRYEGNYVRAVTKQSASIESVTISEADFGSESVKIFNLHGNLVANSLENLPSGFYIEIIGNTVQKIFVK